MNKYKSQLQKNNKPRSLESIRALATLRGSHIGCSAAEAFLLLVSYTGEVIELRSQKQNLSVKLLKKTWDGVMIVIAHFTIRR